MIRRTVAVWADRNGVQGGDRVNAVQLAELRTSGYLRAVRRVRTR